jgi:amidase
MAKSIKRISRDQYNFYFDPAAKPVVSIESGESIVVETEDAHCGTIRDESTVYRSLADVFGRLGGANPVTGPIYVAGAKPGDFLEVSFDKIIPGPVQGQGYTVLTPGLGGLVSDYSLQPALQPRTTICKLDQGHVLFPAKGRMIRIPQRPFIGTMGVAPKGERRLSYLQGRDFLGNVDIPEVTVGNKVILPVNVEGALLALGDAHAVQGDGEISGAAIEVQADVQITARVIPKSDATYHSLPQVNSDGWIGSLAAFAGVHSADVIRASYIDLINRMIRFYGFGMEEAYLLACQTARVRIGQVVDPLYSALVTIDRQYLE